MILCASVARAQGEGAAIGRTTAEPMATPCCPSVPLIRRITSFSEDGTMVPDGGGRVVTRSSDEGRVTFRPIVTWLIIS